MIKQLTKVVAVLTLSTVVGTGMVAFSYQWTLPRILANERMTLLNSLNVLVAHERYDNDLITDTRTFTDKDLLGTAEPITVYRARKNGQPVAAIFNSVAPDGYSGNIYLLVGINMDGTVAGVRVTAHQETPGLGDKIEAKRSSWILNFAGHSLTDPLETGWRVKKDGGMFDQFAGATITPRAVVKAVHNTLRFFQQHRDQVFEYPTR
jgi:Na+-translocating ferredoxin:NAD+ oxidoreductase subunit G